MSLELIASSYDITTSDSESYSDTEDPSPLDSTNFGTTSNTENGHGKSPTPQARSAKKTGRKRIGRRIVTCSLCSKQFVGSYRLSVHMRVHTREKPYQCPICSKRFQQISNIRYHLRNTHRKNSSHYSVESLRTSAKPPQVEHHDPTPTSNSIRKNIQDQNSPSQNYRKRKGFKCPHCFSNFADSNALILHLRTHQSEPSSANPPIRKIVRNMDASNAKKSNGKTLSRGNKVSYPICKCFRSRKTSYREHMKQHSQAGRPLKCSDCPCFFRRQTDLLQHKNEQHGRKPGSTIVACTICQKSFRGGFRLNRHMRVHTQETPFECSICTKKYRHKAHLHRHIKRDHAQNFTSAKAKTPAANSPICNNAAAERKRFKCPVCKCCLSGDRRKHMKLLSKEAGRTLNCPHCPCFFKREMELQRHRSLFHGRMIGKTKFTCKLCKKTFLGGFNLIRHLVVHNGESSFDCPVCQKGFQQSRHLVQHLKASHSKDWSLTSKIAKRFSLEDKHGLPTRLSDELRPCRVILVRCDAKLSSSSKDKSN